MMVANNNIKLCSYNAKNYDPIKYNIIKELFDKCDFLLLQETWLNEKEFIRKFKNDFSNSECISASKMDLDGIKAGRPYGGVAICYHSYLKCQIEYITTNSKSICALKININDISFMLVNVYMPSSDKMEALEEYTTILQEVSSICIQSSTQHLILGGDWNADIARNDQRTKLFKDFILDENLINVLELDISNVPYTYENIRVNPATFSTIDHFLVSPNLGKIVTKYETIFSHNDFSDHFPVMLTLNINIELLSFSKKEYKPCVAWHKCTDANISSYKQEIDNKLIQINPQHEGLKCRNYNCNIHNDYIQKLHNDIIKICCKISENCLPHTSLNQGRKVVPGWNEHVKEHAENSRIWHDIWVQSGRPRHGDIANMKRKTRLKYHYAIRSVTKENIRIRNCKMGEAISNNNDRVLWDEVRKMSKSSHELPSMMDGIAGTEEIANIFGNKYKTLYNLVGYNPQNMKNLENKIESLIKGHCEKPSKTLSVQEVKNGIEKLKLGKKEENGLFSNHLVHGSDRLIVIITLLFNSMLIHGIAPDDLLTGTMIPLIKDRRGNSQNSDNYRALTIGTGLSKLLEIVILNRQTNALKTSELQYGFKTESSTTMCTFMVLETISYYKSRGSNVHMLLLDASKAFDRVNYIKLFNKLIEKGMCPLIVRLLLNMYINQKLQVKWNSCISTKFNVTNGVRQGGILSPMFFSVYIDDLLIKLKNNAVGCHIGNHYVGALGYADDLILLCPSVSGMRKMIKVCEDYANDHSILFNGKKSKYLIFGNYNYNPKLIVNNEAVPRTDNAIHLGHLLHTKDTNNALIDDQINSFHRSFHSFMSRFRSCNTSTKNRLFHQYCRAMYGSQLWLLTSQGTANMCTQWRKAHRQVLSAPYRTHCDIIPLIAGNVPIECFLDCKFLSFYKSIASSENKTVRYVTNINTYDPKSTLGKNILHLIHKYDVSVEDILTSSKKMLKANCFQKWSREVNDQYVIHAHLVRELIDVKEGRLHITFPNCEDGLSFASYDLIINFLCTI